MMVRSSDSKTKLSDPASWVDRYGNYLFRYAIVYLRDRQHAEDAVQETFLAAISARETFSGEAGEKTWLTGILRNKIIDHFRRQARMIPDEDIESTSDSMDEFFDEKGFWKKAPENWGRNPFKAYEQKQFWIVLKKCLQHLPNTMQQAFFMGEVSEYSGKEVCKVLRISSSNYWVLIHRARLKLRSCLEVNWFASEETE
jgi:RNA polymerase sigma-70 factor (ECF subfamily)